MGKKIVMFGILLICIIGLIFSYNYPDNNLKVETNNQESINFKTIYDVNNSEIITNEDEQYKLRLLNETTDLYSGHIIQKVMLDETNNLFYVFVYEWECNHNNGIHKIVNTKVLKVNNDGNSYFIKKENTDNTKE